MSTGAKLLAWFLGPPAERPDSVKRLQVPYAAVPKTSPEIPLPPVPAGKRLLNLAENWRTEPHGTGFRIITDSGCEIAVFASAKAAKHAEWLHNHWVAVESAIPPRRTPLI